MTVNAKDGELVLVVAKNVKVINAPEGTKIVVADGATGLTVNGKSVSDDQTYIVPKTTSSGSSSGGYSHTHSYDATTRKCSCGEFAPDVVATIGDTNGYLTLEAAVAAATNGATVKLVKGALLDADILISSKITLDLNGNTIETNGKKISVAATGDLTVTGNGIVNNQVDADEAGGTMNRYTMLSVKEGGKLTIENGTFTTKAAQIVYTYGSTTIRGGTFKNTSTSEETVDALNSGALIVVCGTPASLTMTGGTVTTESQYLYGVFVQDGGNAIFGDEETENGPSIHTHRYAAIGENNTMPTANITIYGGEYTVSTVPASDAWKPFCATIYASASGDINIYGGTFNGYYGISSRYVNVGQNLNISGGTFNGSNSALFVDTKSGVECSETRTIAITGGTFSSDPSEYVAEGYKATKDESANTWTVKKMDGYVKIEGLSGWYETLTDAAKAWRESKQVVTSGNTFGANSLGTVNSITWSVSGVVAIGNGEGVIGDNGAGQSILGGGYFTPSVTVNSITIKGSNGAKIIKTGDSYLVSAAGQNVVYEDITFVDTVRIDSNPANLTFKNCTFEAGFRMPHSAANGKVTIENCTFTGNESSGYAIFAQGNMASFKVTDSTISNCQRGINVQAGNTAEVTISGNTIENLTGKTENEFTYGSAIQLTSAKTFSVTGNTIGTSEANIPVNAFHIYKGCAADSIKITGNTVYAKYLCLNEATDAGVTYDMSKVTFNDNTCTIEVPNKCCTKTGVIDSAFTLPQ